jgi:hypothetical protein
MYYLCVLDSSFCQQKVSRIFRFKEHLHILHTIQHFSSLASAYIFEDVTSVPVRS